MLTETIHTKLSMAKLAELFAEALVWLEVHDAPGLWHQFLEILAEHHKVETAASIYECVEKSSNVYNTSLEAHYIEAPCPEVATTSFS